MDFTIFILEIVLCAIALQIGTKLKKITDGTNSLLTLPLRDWVTLLIKKVGTCDDSLKKARLSLEWMWRQ